LINNVQSGVPGKKVKMSKNILDEILSAEKENNLALEDSVLEPLLSEINVIHNEEIRSFVRSVLLKDDYFWSSPEVENEPSRPFDETGPDKSILHTKRVVRIASILSAAYLLSQEENDVVIAACLLHHISRYKDFEIEEKTYTIYDPMHPYTIGEFVSCTQSADKEMLQENISTTLFLNQENLFSIMRLIRCQLGVWSPIPETYPVTYLDYIVNIAVIMANNIHHLIQDSELIDERWRNKDSSS
jgi:hypothetical protein